MWRFFFPVLAFNLWSILFLHHRNKQGYKIYQLICLCIFFIIIIMQRLFLLNNRNFTFFTQVLILCSLPSLLQFYKLKICWRIEPNIDTLYIQFFFWWIIIRNYAIVMLYLQKKNILAWEAFLTNSVHITFRRIQTGNCSEKKHFLFHPQTPHIRRHFDKKRRHKDYLHLLKKRSNFKI